MGITQKEGIKMNEEEKPEIREVDNIGDRFEVGAEQFGQTVDPGDILDNIYGAFGF